MIGKVVIGKTFGGCISYVVQKKDAQLLYSTGIRTENIRTMTDDFNMQRKIRPSLGKAVGHISLNWSLHDKARLTPEMMLATAQDYLLKMNIRDTQVLIIQHKDTAHPHLHIIYNRVNNQGKTITDQYQYKKNILVCRELTLKQGFHLSKGKTQVNRQQLKGADQVKYKLYDLIQKARLNAKDWKQFEGILAKDQVSLLFKYKGQTNEVQGISFRLGEYSFKGSEIDRSFSYGKLDAGFGLLQQASLIAPAEQAYIMEQQNGENQFPYLKASFEQSPASFHSTLLGTLLAPVSGGISADQEDPNSKKKKRKKGQSTGLSR